MAAAYAIVSGGGPHRLGVGDIAGVSRLAALAAWRPTQGIYRYDPALYAALADTSISGDLPCDILYHLPEWCVYIDTPGQQAYGDRLHGFFAHLERDANSGIEELRLLLDTDAGLHPQPLHLGAWTLDEAITRAIELAQANVRSIAPPVPDLPPSLGADIRQTVEPLISLLLYLCADDAEIGDSTRRPAYPRPIRTKLGWRLFAPDQPTIWDVGVRLGAALRRAYALHDTDQYEIDPQTGRTRPRAHIRRAHWHTYLVGPGRTARCLRWLPPIAVNVDDVPDHAPPCPP
ncbi:MAG: hypothetical protein IPI58_09815 [Alphaproteobacteria bacterium]|nr:MAG: hypothetical protein IPI58_09815 [Alphaproteobacteria bacterium]